MTLLCFAREILYGYWLVSLVIFKIHNLHFINQSIWWTFKILHCTSQIKIWFHAIHQCTYESFSNKGFPIVIENKFLFFFVHFKTNWLRLKVRIAGSCVWGTDLILWLCKMADSMIRLLSTSYSLILHKVWMFEWYCYLRYWKIDSFFVITYYFCRRALQAYEF